MTDHRFEVATRPRREWRLVYGDRNEALPLGKEAEENYVEVGTYFHVWLGDEEEHWRIVREQSKSGAIREMEEFIRQAQEALARLRALK